MLTSILIDDEPRALRALENKLTAYCAEVQIIGKAGSAQDAFDLITTLNPDLIFLDVAMPKETGFDLLNRLPDLNFEIIFVTAFDDRAIDAFKFSAVGYIVKPIESQDLLAAVKRAKKRIAIKQEIEHNKELLRNLSKPLSSDNRIGIPSADGYEFIEVERIIRCEGLQRCTKVFLEDQKNITSSYNLGEFVKLLTPYKFFSPHRSHLVNLSHITRYDRTGSITLKDGSIVPVSRRKRQEFLKQMTYM